MLGMGLSPYQEVFRMKNLDPFKIHNRLVAVMGVWMSACALALLGCSRPHSAMGSHDSDAAANLALQPGWQEFKSPVGFSLQIPTGWSVQAGKSYGAVRVQGSAGQQVMIWPLFLHDAVQPSTMSTLAQSVGARLCDGSSFQSPQPMGDAALRLIGTCNGGDAVLILGWRTSEKGSSLLAALAAAPTGHFQENAATFATLLQSWHVTGAAAQGAVSYVVWKEPNEGAFIIDAPSGWQVGGGLRRFTDIETRKEWSTLSSDSSIWLTGGDVALPMHMTRVPTAEAYYPEGSWYTSYGQQFLVKHYQPAGEFLQEYVRARFSPYCSNIVLGDMVPRPDLEQALWQIEWSHAPAGWNVRLSQAEVHFTCQRGEQPMEGYTLAGTTFIGTGAIEQWYVETLFAYLAASSKSFDAATILQHIGGSLRLDPDWAAKQAQRTMKAVSIIREAQEAVSTMIKKVYENREHTVDEISRRQSNSTLSKVDVIDPSTSTQYKVDSSANYYWIDDLEHIVGTQLNANPGIDYRAMVQLP